MKTPQNSRSRQSSLKTTQRAKKPTGRQVKGKNLLQPQQPKSRLKRFLVTLGAIAALIMAGGVLVGGIRLALLIMIDPNAIVWLNQYLPEWTRIPIANASLPQTLTAIEAEVRQEGLIPGEPQFLDTELLLPILGLQPNCQTECEYIVELRVYQPAQSTGREKSYYLVNQLSITGPEEYFVFSPPTDTKVDDAGVSRTLPLTTLTPLDNNAPTQGFWFNLSGQQLSGDIPRTYGQIIHYNPDQMHLSVMLQWTTPEQYQPYWQQVTGTSTPELVVNQTIGMEPHFKVYQIQPRQFVPNPIYLEEITLTQPAIDTQTYRNALILARNGLWSGALQQLQLQKKKNWSTAAQAQMDTIQLHAQVTKSQAEGSWVSPSQQIFAQLLDGRWAEALKVFESAADGAPVQEVAALLKADPGTLWNRVEAALKVNPKDNQVKAWGALMLTAQQGRAKAIAWLNQLSTDRTKKADNVNKPDQPEQSELPANQAWIKVLLDHLEGTAAVTPISYRWSQIVGTAQVVKKVNPKDWLQPENQRNFSVNLTSSASQASTLQKETNQVWYQVQVAAFNDGQRWLQMPFAKLSLPKIAPSKQLWTLLGLDSNPQILITVWTSEGQQESTIATIKAVSYKGNAIQLLAVGDAPATPTPGTSYNSHALAYTETTLRWLDPVAMSLSDLNQAQPQWTSALLPNLRRELLKSSQFKANDIPSEAALLSKMGHWLVRPVDLTGNNQPEAVVTLYEDLSTGVNKSNATQFVDDSKRYKRRTLIFSETGALLYSELSKDANASLIAIADLGDGGSAALVLNGRSNYSLKRWSGQNKRFE
ncbi:MAG TPA: hypothetical protein V6C95_17640 [Coleofasciculaceae cyanobacterium]